MAIFGQYKGTKSPLMTWYAEYSYSRISNSVVQVAVTVTGEINNHASTSWMGTGNNIVVTVTVAGASKTHEIKSSSSAWYGNTNNPRSCYFVFDVPSAAAGQNIGVSYSVAGSGYTAAAAVPTQSTSFESPALLYTASQPSVGNAVMGSAVTIYTNRQYDTMTHTVKWSFGNSSGTVGTGVGGSVNWTPGIDLAAQIPNAPSGAGEITCDTYVGDTYIGTKTTPIAISIPSGSSAITPSCDLTIDLVRTSEPENWGVYVKGYSRYQARVNAAGKYGASISSCSVSGGGYSGASTDFMSSGVLWSVGDNVITARVTDSRGQTAESTKTITVYDYDKPSIKSTNVFRCNADGTANERGASVSVTANFSFSSVGGKNSLTAVVQWKKTSESYFGNSTAIQSGKTVVAGGESIDPNYSYTFRVLLTDAINSSYSDAPISSIVYPVYIKDGGKAVAFGKTTEADELVDSAWPMKAPEFQGKATGAADADKLGGEAAGNYAKRGSPNNLLHSGNEFTYAPNGFSGEIWHNYRTANWDANGNITGYYFGNGKGGYGGVTLYADRFSGTAAKSDKATNADMAGGASTILGSDRRNDNNEPASYFWNHTGYTEQNFRYNSVVGAPLEGNFCSLFGVAPWGNASGGYPAQVAINQYGMGFRGGVSDGAWGPWGRILDSRRYAVGCFWVPNYTCNTAAGYGYYGDVTVNVAFGKTLQFCSEIAWSLQAAKGTTGVIDVEPLSWDTNYLYTIRIHRSSAVTNIGGFRLDYIAIAV